MQARKTGIFSCVRERNPRWVLLLVALAAVIHAAHGEPSWRSFLKAENTRFWLESGFGPSSVQFANGGSANLEYRHILLSLAFDYNWEYSMFGPEPDEKAYEICLAAGTSTGSRFFTFATAIGPAFVSGVNRGDSLYTEPERFGDVVYEREDFHTAGLAMHTHIIFTPLRFMGIGAHGYANLNAKRMYAGAMGSLYFGKF